MTDTTIADQPLPGMPEPATAAAEATGLAPWPRTTDRATADALARHYTVEAYTAHCRLYHHPGLRAVAERDWDGKPAGQYRTLLRAFVDASNTAFDLYAVAYLLREANGYMSMKGDDLAARLHSDRAGDDEVLMDHLTDWLDEYGIDPEQIIRDVEVEQPKTPNPVDARRSRIERVAALTVDDDGKDKDPALILYVGDLRQALTGPLPHESGGPTTNRVIVPNPPASEPVKRDAFDIAREALLTRYGTLDQERMRALGADSVEIGAAKNITAREG
jgi:hypothetical protein